MTASRYTPIHGSASQPRTYSSSSHTMRSLSNRHVLAEMAHLTLLHGWSQRRICNAFLRRHVLPTDELPSSDIAHEVCRIRVSNTLIHSYILTSTQILTEQNDALLDSTFFLISAESLFEFLQPHEIPPVPYSFDKGSEVRYIPTYLLLRSMPTSP